MALLPMFAVNPTLAQMQAISNNVVGYWRWDGDATDEDPTGSDLTIETGTFSDAYVSQSIKGAWVGGSTTIDRRYSITTADTSLRIDGNMTISCLINLNYNFLATGAQETGIIEMSDLAISSTATPTAAANRYALMVDDEAALKIHFSNGAGGQDRDDLGDSIRLQPGLAHHLVLRRSGTTLEIYLNGVLAGSTTLTAASGNGTGNNLLIGRNVSTAGHSFAIAALCMWNVALTPTNISDLYDIHLLENGEFSPKRVAMASGLDIDFAAAEVFSKDPAGAPTTFTISNPQLHRTRTVEIIDTTGGADINVPATVDWMFGEAPADVDADSLVQNRRYLLQIYCDDEVTPHYWASFRKEDA